MSKKEEKTKESIQEKVPMSTYVDIIIADFTAVAAEELGVTKTWLRSKLQSTTTQQIMDIQENYRCTIKEAILMWNFHQNQSFDFH